MLVSGGADSMCLWGVLGELGYNVDALHVEHGLRGEAGVADAVFCEGRGASVVSVAVAPGGNVEARARDARYAAAREYAAGRDIAVGHTVSDQAETVLYRLASSSGPRALSAMRPRQGDLVRPLLAVTAAETREWCAAHGIEPRHDASNDDLELRAKQAAARGDARPPRVHPGAEQNLARTAELLAELDELLAELTDPMWRRSSTWMRSPGCRAGCGCWCCGRLPSGRGAAASALARAHRTARGARRADGGARAALACARRRCGEESPYPRLRAADAVSSLAMTAELEHAGTAEPDRRGARLGAGAPRAGGRAGCRALAGLRRSRTCS